MFDMMFSAMLTDAFQDCDDGFPITYRFDGKLFNLRRLQAEDMAKNASTERKMQEATDRVSQVVITMISKSA